MKYTDKAIDIVSRATNEYEGLRQRENEIERQYRDDLITGTVKAEELAELRPLHQNIYNGAKADLEQLRDNYMEAAEKSSLVTGSMLHEDAKLLENPNLTLTQIQVQKMVDQHRNNPVMVQLLKKYVAEHDLEVTGLPASLAEKKQAFWNFIDTCCGVVSPSCNRITLGMVLDGKVTPAICTEYI